MEFVENRLRGSLFIDRLAKGDTGWDAAKKVFQAHFDYAPEGMSQFEKLVMKRVIPFYTWQRNNIPFQLAQMVKQPEKYSGVAKVLRSLQGATSEERAEVESLPRHMRERFPIRLGKDKGKTNYLYGIGLPLEDIAELSPQQQLSRMSPLIKTPLELATNRHFYFEKPLEDVIYAPQIVSKFPDPLKKWLEYTETPKKDGGVTRKLNPVKWHLTTSLLSRGLFTADKLSDPKVQTHIKFLYSMLGVKGKSVDIEQEKYWRGREEQEKINKLLQRL